MSYNVDVALNAIPVLVFLNRLDTEQNWPHTHTQWEDTQKNLDHIYVPQPKNNLFKNTKIGIAFKATPTLQQLTGPKPKSKYQNMEKVEYTKSHVTPVIKHMLDKPIAI
jgi:hypothetical protein